MEQAVHQRGRCGRGCVRVRGGACRGGHGQVRAGVKKLQLDLGRLSAVSNETGTATR